ncbi:iron chelate uptake ABC transporter family permease subunit, partial [Gemella sp. 19428wG2_WT2a]
FFFLPIFIFIGGLIPFLVLFLLVSRYHITPIRLILVGVAIYAMLNGVLELFSMSPVMQLPRGFTMKVWQDVYIIVAFSIVGLTIAYMLAEKVNLLSFDDKQANNIGFNITKYRLIIGLVAVFLASSATAIVGQLAFVGLIVPHIVRRLV